MVQWRDEEMDDEYFDGELLLTTDEVNVLIHDHVHLLLEKVL